MRIEEKLDNSETPINVFADEKEETVIESDIPELFKYVGNNSDGEIIFNTLHLRNKLDEPLSLGRDEAMKVEQIHEFNLDALDGNGTDEEKRKLALRTLRNNPEINSFYLNNELVLAETVNELKQNMTKHMTLHDFYEENGLPWDVPIKVKQFDKDYESPVDDQIKAIRDSLEKSPNYRTPIQIIDMGQRSRRAQEAEEDKDL